MRLCVVAVVVIVKGLTFAHNVHVVDADVDGRYVKEIVVVEAIIVGLIIVRLHGAIGVDITKCVVVNFIAV